MICLSVWTFPFGADAMIKGKLFVPDYGLALWSLLVAGVDAAIVWVNLNLAGADFAARLAERRERERQSAGEGVNLLDKALVRFEQNRAAIDEALNIMKDEPCREGCMSQLSRAQQKLFDAKTMLAAGRYTKATKTASSGFAALSNLENKLHEITAHHKRRQHTEVVQVSEQIIASETIQVKK